MSELPDIIKRFDILKIERSIQKLCQCYGTPHYTVDTSNRLVYCDDCGAIVDPFEALKRIADSKDEYARHTQYMLDQRREIVNYKPWLLVFRNLESHYRSKEMLPCCPNCREPFYFENIDIWHSRKLYERQKEHERGAEK